MSTDDPIRPTPPMMVEPPTEAPPPEPEKDEIPPPAPESAEGETPAAEPVEGADEKTEAEPVPPKADEPPKSERQKLIDSLTGVGEEKPEPKDEEPEPPAPQEKAPVEGDGKQPEKAPEQDPDLVELTNDSAKVMKPGEARRKINRLIDRIKQAEPLATMSKEIIETCEANGFAPDDYKAWVGIGIGIQQGNPKAIEAFQKIAEKAGIMPTATSTVPENLETWLEGQVKDLEISTAAAAELRKLLNSSPKPKAAAPPAPPPETPPAPQAQSPRAQPRADPTRVRGEQAIDKVVAEYEAKLGAARFAEVQPRILAALKARKGAHPDAWGDIMRTAFEVEIAKAPKPKTLGTSVRPGTQSGPSKPVFKSERERVIHEYTA